MFNGILKFNVKRSDINAHALRLPLLLNPTVYYVVVNPDASPFYRGHVLRNRKEHYSE